MAYYRIVTDAYMGYEVQCWQWWWPFWVQAGGVNTFGNVMDAERYARAHSRRGVVCYLGNLSDDTND